MEQRRKRKLREKIKSGLSRRRKNTVRGKDKVRHKQLETRDIKKSVRNRAKMRAKCKICKRKETRNVQGKLW